MPAIRKNAPYRQYFILCAIEALISLAILFAIPGEGGSAAILGYSRTRWGLAAWLVLGGLAALLASGSGRLAGGWEKIEAREQETGLEKILSGVSLLLSAGGFYFTWVFAGLTDAQVKGVFLRLLPLVLWMTLAGMQGLLLLAYSHSGRAIAALHVHSRTARQWLVRHAADFAALGLLIVVCAALLLPLTTGVSRTDNSDYLAHVRAAQRMEESGKNETPYFLYQLLIIGAHLLTPARDLLSLGIGVAVAFQVFTAGLLFVLVRWSLRKVMAGRPAQRALLSAVLSLGLLLVTPLTLFSAAAHNLYYGYIGIQVYHNPTVILLKPLALLLFLGVLPMFGRDANNTLTPGAGYYLTVAGVTLLGVLAKPNFIIAFLPAAGLFWVFSILSKEKMNGWGVWLSVFIPALLLLAWQYLAAYTDASVIPDEGGIAFAPLAVYARSSGFLPAKFLLSILFPLCATLGYFSKARKDFGLTFAWVIFGFGAFYTYFLAESGARLQDANFAWSGQVTLFVLFTAAFLFFVRRVIKSGWDKRAWICAAVFGLHLLSGILWYVIHLLRPWNAWW